MDVRLLFPSLYISAADLRGKDVTLTISSVTVEDLRTERGSEKKPVVYFEEMAKRNAQGKGENKRLCLNKTNAKTIAKLYGYETKEWHGKKITLYPTTCQAFGQVVECVRVRAQAPPSRGNRKPDPPPEPAANEDPDPFDLQSGEATP